jgi:hypothetical protein
VWTVDTATGILRYGATVWRRSKTMWVRKTHNERAQSRYNDEPVYVRIAEGGSLDEIAINKRVIDRWVHRFVWTFGASDGPLEEEHEHFIDLSTLVYTKVEEEEEAPEVDIFKMTADELAAHNWIFVALSVVGLAIVFTAPMWS